MTIAEGLATVVQVVATASSFYVASSPYASIKEIHVNKSTGKLSAIPLLCMLLSSSMWLLYSILLRNFFPLIFTNVVYLSCVIGYLAVYYKYSNARATLHRYFFVEGVWIMSVYCYAAISPSPTTTRLEVVGIIAITCSSIMVVSPLSAIAEVLKTRSVAHLPRKLIFATWISSGAWCLTGIILDNAFIKYPNAINFILGSLQLALFLIFPSASVAVAQSSGKGVDLDRVGLLTADPDEISSGVDKSSQVDTYIHATHDIK
ncbi:hypothetical protein H310_10120 [Aphanomyces invadans]|uniref:Sugar transporter SWEET1 n=1 Tax=Aphanomyces invadans TaxID=157072 RepID=A0A024TS39_9STRA|nr:hypothetical protein H310_10120 [Aphanomyces invadans]ETV96829.1 hypothetical protein H310_10120 [Aphanomyces invadans]|eukprot:XP_008874606.1 hypothetical protein H310_10120 [Aphanomyces invadans]